MKRLLDLTSRNIDVGQVAQHLLLRYLPCVCHPRIPTTFGRMVNHSWVHPNLRTVCRRVGDRVHLLLVATTDVKPNEEFFFDYGVRSDDEGSRLSFLMT
jgi:hypothetical protein